MTNSALALVIAVAVGITAPASASTGAQEEAPPPSVAIDLGEIVVFARRPGKDPSQATTECIWLQLPADQRLLLSLSAGEAVSSLAYHDQLPLVSPNLDEDAVADALFACGGIDEPSLLRFVSVALAAYAVENETVRALRGDRVSRDRLVAAWRALSAERQETLVLAAMTPDALTEPEADLLVLTVFDVLRRVRPLGAMNPFAYRNGSANHRVVYFTEAFATRIAMERLF